MDEELKQVQEERMQQIRALLLALTDDFRGFLIDGERLEVKDDELHALVAKKYLEENVPDYEYISGRGQDPILELLNAKNAIYITRIETPEKEYQRTVSYLKTNNLANVIYKQKRRLVSDVIREISLGMGYDVDEQMIKPGSNPIQSTVITYKAETKVTKSYSNEARVSRNPDDKAIIGADGKTILGYMHNGRFYSAEHYNKKTNYNDENPGGTGEGR